MNTIYNYWLKSENVPEVIKEEMKLMTKKDVDNSFVDEKLKFGTAGYRAVMGPGNKYLNEFTYQQLAYGYGYYLKEVNKDQKTALKVLIAHDNRHNSLKFSNVVARVLTSMGIKVLFFKDNMPSPTPLVSFTIKVLKLSGAINITASHNPKNYNGFKAYNKYGAQLLPEESEIVSENLPNWKKNLKLNPEANNNLISYVNKNIVNQYLNDIKSRINLNSFKKNNEPIVITTHHGVLSNNFYFEFLRKLGHNICPVESQCFIDNDFINSTNLNPEEKASFKLAEEYAKQIKADIMLGFDPDGDRLAVVVKHKGKWVYLNGNETGCIASYYLLNYKKTNDKVPIVISTYVSNNLINEIVQKFDGLVLRTGTGFKFLGYAMDHLDNNAKFIIGFEEAIGMCISDNIREKDGLAAAALILEIYKFYKERGMTLVDVFNIKICQGFGNWYGCTKSITLNSSNLSKKIIKIESDILNTDINKIDNFRIHQITWNKPGQCIEMNMNDGRSWIKFRASGTEPKFKVYYNLFFDEENNYNSDEMCHEKKSDIVKSIHQRIIKKFGIY